MKLYGETIALALVVAAFVAGLSWAAIWGVNRTEVLECEKWQLESQRYEGYFLADWQSKQCSHHGIEIGAPEYTQEELDQGFTWDGDTLRPINREGKEQ